MKHAPHIPERCLGSVLADGVFAAAYDLLEPERRAWIKKLAAQLHVLAEPEKRLHRRDESTWATGFSTSIFRYPVTSALLFIDSDVVSPVQVAAAALPPLFCGARSLTAVRVGTGSDRPDFVLATLEMCGVETVYALEPGGAADCLAAALCDRNSAVLILGQADWCDGSLNGSAAFVWRRPQIREMAVLADPESDLDYETMAWAHPDGRFRVYGSVGENMPKGFELAGQETEEIEAGEAEVLFASSLPSVEVSEKFSLVLGPGQEGCFFWPELIDPRIYARRMTIWDSINSDSENGELL